jgi:hypothetical protein
LDGAENANSSTTCVTDARLYGQDNDRWEFDMGAIIVRYRVKPGRAEENAALVRAVYAELAEAEPPGFRYATFVLEDGVTFVHIAFTEDGEDAPLPHMPAFQRFQREIADRCDDPPQVTRSSQRIGAYRL